jgi:predicted transcriptional regulator
MSYPTAILPAHSSPFSELHYFPVAPTDKNTCRIKTNNMGGSTPCVSMVQINNTLPREVVTAAINMCTNHEKSMVFSNAEASYYCAPVMDGNHVVGTLIAQDKSNMVPETLLEMLKSSR